MRKRRKITNRKRIGCIITVVLMISVFTFLTYNLFELVKSKQNTINNVDIEPTSISTTETKSTESPYTQKGIDYQKEGGILELPINGASGYASISLRLREGPGTETNIITTLDPGKGFTILEESNDWWKIETGEKIGWVMHKYCFINLPDVIPSIIYDNTNTYSSKIMSSGKSIPNVTGLKLYDAFGYNERLSKDEYIVPVLYAMAPKICRAQQAALADGNTLIIYEAFRPFAVQRNIVANLSSLVNSDQSVKAGVTDAQWSIGWFISTSLSNHQKGYAIDVSLGDVMKQELKSSGTYIYKNIKEYKEYTMPSQIHELSIASIVYKAPVPPTSDTLWKDAITSDSLNSEAKLLQQYCTDAGLTPLASEWWHFNDLSFAGLSEKVQSDGKYFIQENQSKAPNDKFDKP